MPFGSGGGGGALPADWSVGGPTSLDAATAINLGANDGIGDAGTLTLDGVQGIAELLGTTSILMSAPAWVLLTINAAPADGLLGAGDLALWFDKTNGAAKLMVKAKQADGSVKTASIALA